jgi:hypothetical protein
MDSTSESEFVSPLSRETKRDEPETCLLSHHPIRGETETTGGQRDRKARIEYSIVLTPQAGNWQAPPEKRLARLLKTMLRAYGWRCNACRPVTPAEPPPPPAQQQNV